MSTIINFRMPGFICDQLKSYARQDRRSLSMLVRLMVEEGIAKREAADRKRAKSVVHMEDVGREDLRGLESAFPGLEAEVNRIALKGKQKQAQAAQARAQAPAEEPPAPPATSTEPAPTQESVMALLEELRETRVAELRREAMTELDRQRADVVDVLLGRKPYIPPGLAAG